MLFAAWSAKTQPLEKGDGFLRALGFAEKGAIRVSAGVIINELHQRGRQGRVVGKPLCVGVSSKG
jgi:hypothetical protein